MSLFHDSAIVGASGQGGAAGYQISRSLRFNSSDSAYLSRTPASAGNRKTWTVSFWVKRAALGSTQYMFEGGSPDGATTRFALRFNSTDTINILNNGTFRTTTQVFRDVSAWYHILLAVDTTQSTASSRIRFYVNGSEVTTFSSSTDPSLNADTGWNMSAVHSIGTTHIDGGNYLNAYLADFYSIDGQALDPTSFTEVSATTGQLIPKAYSGTFTGNSFWLKFADNSAATATTLGKDSSGLGNNWTPNNLYVSNTVYSSGVSITGSYANNTNARMAFDGSTSTKLEMSGSNNQITFTPPAAISFSSTVEVFLTPTGDVTYTRYSFNGGADTSFAAGDGWKTVASGGGTFTSLVLKQGAQSNNIGFAAIRINGSTILVDASSADNDSLVDTPSSGSQVDTGLGGQVTGNYCTLNPLNRNSNANLSNGNLNFSLASAGFNYGTFATFGVRTGKWYFEASIDSFISYGITTGFVTSDWNKEYIGSGGTAYFGLDTTGGRRSSAGITASGSTVTYGAGDVVGVAFDADAGTATIYKNGSSIYTFSGIPANDYFPALSSGGSSAWINFGQRPFAYTAPSGFKALCDTNLPAPVVAKPNTVFDVITFTGNGASNRSLTGLNFSPEFLWFKNRTDSSFADHCLHDIVRGATNALYSNSTTSEEATGTGQLVSFDSAGFTIGSQNNHNGNGDGIVTWCWDAGSSTVTNTQGSITSQVRANASAGFSIVTYTGNGSTSQTVGHGLGVKPGLIIVKSRSNGTWNWGVYHQSLSGSTPLLTLNTTGAANNLYNAFNPANNSSAVFGIGDEVTTNQSGGTYVAYCFAPVAGYSSFGSWSGSGNSNGSFIYTGFTPRWILARRTDIAENWVIWDTARETYNPRDDVLWPHSSQAEITGDGYARVDVVSNGFKFRNASFPGLDGSGGTYLYAAFASAPFQYSRAQ